VWGGQQIVPAAYVAASIKPDAPHLAPGKPIVADHPLPLGYGYQWWIPKGDRGEFTGVGVYNQYVFVDPSRLAADPEQAGRFPELPYLTVRLGYMACEYFKADTGLALVRAEHQAFYRRVFLQETIAEPRPIPIILQKVALMACDFPTVREKVLTRFPIMRSSAFERRTLFERASERHSSLDGVVASFEPASIVPNS